MLIRKTDTRNNLLPLTFNTAFHTDFDTCSKIALWYCQILSSKMVAIIRRLDKTFPAKVQLFTASPRLVAAHPACIVPTLELPAGGPAASCEDLPQSPAPLPRNFLPPQTQTSFHLWEKKPCLQTVRRVLKLRISNDPLQPSNRPVANCLIL